MGVIPGIEFNTFSITGRCSRTGMLGIAITTSDITVGSRCPYVKSSVGAVATQASTDPGLGPFALNLLQLGYSASGALQQLEASDPHIERRQLAIVDHNGNAAARTINGPATSPERATSPWVTVLLGKGWSKKWQKCSCILLTWTWKSAC